MSLIWRLDLCDGSSLKVGDDWPGDKPKPGEALPKINAILLLPETRETVTDEDGDPLVTVYAGSYMVAVLPDGSKPEPGPETPMPMLRVPVAEVRRAHEIHSWSELQTLVAEALGLGDPDEDGDEPSNGAGVSAQPNATGA